MENSIRTATRALQDYRAAFVWAPVSRCGTGLLQRLITSSREIFVFGEDRFFTRSVPQAMLAHTIVADTSKHAREKLEAGDYSGWSPGVLPRHEHYVAAMIHTFASICLAYQSTATAAGFPRFGTKLPQIHPDELAVIEKLLPRAKHVVIYRHVCDVLASQKARLWIKTENDLREWTARWTQGVHFALAKLAKSPNFLIVRYEDLLAERATAAERLCRFLEVGSLDLSVFDQKVNTWAGDEAKGHSPTQYIAPKRLTDAERAIALGIARPVLAAAGYSDDPPPRAARPAAASAPAATPANPTVEFSADSAPLALPGDR
jgi:hypothetical protein